MIKIGVEDRKRGMDVRKKREFGIQILLWFLGLLVLGWLVLRPHFRGRRAWEGFQTPVTRNLNLPDPYAGGGSVAASAVDIPPELISKQNPAIRTYVPPPTGLTQCEAIPRQSQTILWMCPDMNEGGKLLYGPNGTKEAPNLTQTYLKPNDALCIREYSSSPNFFCVDVQNPSKGEIVRYELQESRSEFCDALVSTYKDLSGNIDSLNNILEQTNRSYDVAKDTKNLMTQLQEKRCVTGQSTATNPGLCPTVASSLQSIKEQESTLSNFFVSNVKTPVESALATRDNLRDLLLNFGCSLK